MIKRALSIFAVAVFLFISGVSLCSEEVISNSSRNTVIQIDEELRALRKKMRDALSSTIPGTKTFVNFPYSPSSLPTEDYQFANVKYVDTLVSAIGVYSKVINIQAQQDTTSNVEYDVSNSSSTITSTGGNALVMAEIDIYETFSGSSVNMIFETSVDGVDDASTSVTYATVDGSWVRCSYRAIVPLSAGSATLSLRARCSSASGQHSIKIQSITYLSDLK